MIATPIRLIGYSEQLLSKIETLLYKEELEQDSETYFAYVYKSIPDTVKRSHLADWITLQAKLLSPFQNGHVYYFVGKKYVAFWLSKTPFHNLPETALQRPLENGHHIISGSKLHYRQLWRDGQLVECEVIPELNNEKYTKIDIAVKYAWAYQRKIDKVIRQPSFFAALLITFAIFTMSWHAVGILSLSLQENRLDTSISEYEIQLGEELESRAAFQRNTKLVSSLYYWQQEFAHLPQAMSSIIAEVLTLGQFKANSIRWQDRKLILELIGKDIDIAALVQKLEASNQFSSVSIRPNNVTGNWSLEVTING